LTSTNGEQIVTTYYGGDTVATCPALYAHYLATTLADVPEEKVRMVAIGNQDYSSMKITDKVSTLDWVYRLF
jgi:hypothetical protein